MTVQSAIIKNQNNYQPTIQKIFQGCENYRGIFIKWDGKSKLCKQEPRAFNWDEHLKGTIQGLSPVDLETQTAFWYAIDVDLKNIEVKKFTTSIYSLIGSEFFVFRTMSGGFRVVYFYDDAVSAEVAEKDAEETEKQIERLGYKCDSMARCPRGYSSEAPGRWIFMPYHNPDETYCYTPDGKKLSLKQFEFRYRHRKNPMVVACVGMDGQGFNSSRNKALWAIIVHNKLYPNDAIDLIELNAMFGTPYSDAELHKEIKSTTKSAFKEKWDQEKYLNGLNTWIKAIIGVSPGFSNSLIQEVVEAIYNKYIYLRCNKDFLELESREFVDKEAMNDWWYVQTKGRPVVKELLTNPNLVKVYSFLTHPSFDSGVITINPGQILGIKPGVYFNLYKPGNFEGTPGDVSEVLNYYRLLYGEDADHLFNFIALLFQKPGYKCRWAVLQITPPGAGKDILTEILSRALGEDNVALNCTFERLVSDHSTILNGKQLLILNEMMLNGTRMEGKVLANKLKPFITNDVQTLNPKFKSEIVIPNYCNFICHSNDAKPIKLESDDRRICVLHSKVKKAEVNTAIGKVINKLKQLKQDPSAFIYHFKNIHQLPQLDYFDGDAPSTDAKINLINIGKDDFEGLMDDAFKEKTFPFASQKWEDATDKDRFHNSSWKYVGMINVDNLFTALTYHQKFKKVFFTKALLTEWINNHSIVWNNGEKTRRAKVGHSFPRMVLLEDLPIADGSSSTTKDRVIKNLTEMSEGELGKVYSYAKFIYRGVDEYASDNPTVGVSFAGNKILDKWMEEDGTPK